MFIDFTWTIIWDFFIVEYPPTHEPTFAGINFMYKSFEILKTININNSQYLLKK